MAYESFVDINFRTETRYMINDALSISRDYLRRGFTLTLRQLFYQFVARNLLANTDANYTKLGNVVRDARRSGNLDWDAFEDRTRNLLSLPNWDDPADRIASAAGSYREDVWASQPYRPEVWIEKDAGIGVIEGVCNEFRVPYFSCRGNVSDPEMYAAGKRFAAYIEQGQVPIVLHIGDHDPSGCDMTRDIRERLALFARQDIEVRRLALNLDQTAGLPTNFAKESDGKWTNYVRQYDTDKSWELDALDPTFIADLIRDALVGLIDTQAWDDAMNDEEASRMLLTKASDNWSKVEETLDDIA